MQYFKKRAKRRWPRGATPRLRPGAEAGSTQCPKGGSQEELPHVGGQGQRPRIPDCDSAGTAERSYPASEVKGCGREEIPASEVRGCNKRSYSASEVRGGGQEDQPHIQGAVAAQAQEGLEGLSHFEGQEGWR